MRPPQPSAVGPHATPCCAQVFGVHVVPTHWLFTQVIPIGQSLQVTTFPHPSLTCPH
jgi:hypothetical protein